jgi:hypothetical protein
MHHNISKVNKHPFARVFSFYSNDALPYLRNFLFEVVYECFCLACGIDACNDNPIE